MGVTFGLEDVSPEVPDRPSFKTLLKELARRNGYETQAEMARALGMGEYALSLYLNGKRRIPLWVIRKARALFSLTDAQTIALIESQGYK